MHPGTSTPDRSEADPEAPQPLVVQKYGGSSLAEVSQIQRVAERVVTTHESGCKVLVVVSAMGKTTDGLLELARQVHPDPEPRELDMLLTSGERTSIALLALAIQRRGVPAISLTGSQAGILTDDQHNDATIIEVRPFRIEDELERGRVVVVAGFQGESYRGEDTTLGRGGSDTTAVALAAALDASHCDIFSDVDGVYSADPRVVDSAERLDHLSFEEMQELSRRGARVLNADAVEFARRRGIAIYARATQGSAAHTVIRTDGALEAKLREMRAHGVTGVTGREDIVELRLTDLDREAELLEALNGCDVLMAWVDTGAELVHLLIATENVPQPAALVRRLRVQFDHSLSVDAGLGAASAVGLGAGTRSQAILEARHAIEEAGIDVQSCFTGSESISCVVRQELVTPAQEALHSHFMESAPTPELEMLVS